MTLDDIPEMLCEWRASNLSFQDIYFLCLDLFEDGCGSFRANETDLIPRTWIDVHPREHVMVGNYRSTARRARRDRDVEMRAFLVEKQATALVDAGRHLDARRASERRRN